MREICMSRQIHAQEREVRMLQRAGAGTASAELLLSRMRAKVHDFAASAKRCARAVQPDTRARG
jgi:hypothetical protein